MKLIKNILIWTASILTVFVLLIWLYGTFGPKMIGGCFDTTKDIGWPLVAYTSAGYYQTCGDGHIAEEWHLMGLLLDVVAISTVLYWLGVIINRIRTRLLPPAL